MHYDGDNDGPKKEDEKSPMEEPDAIPGKFNTGDDVGTRVGEGHDPVEDEVT